MGLLVHQLTSVFDWLQAAVTENEKYAAAVIANAFIISMLVIKLLEPCLSQT
jgi:hypothetical protein